MVTVTARLVESPAPPVIVNVQAPAAVGVTVNDVPAAGAIDAQPRTRRRVMAEATTIPIRAMKRTALR